MRIKFIEQWKFRLAGRSVPVVHASCIDGDGKIGVLEWKGNLKKRDNSIQSTWDAKACDIDPKANMISLTDERGITVQAYVTSEQGKTINLYTDPRRYLNAEDLLGRGSMWDDITDAIGIGRAFKNVAIGIVIGIVLWMFLGPNCWPGLQVMYMTCTKKEAIEMICELAGYVQNIQDILNKPMDQRKKISDRMGEINRELRAFRKEHPDE